MVQHSLLSRFCLELDRRTAMTAGNQNQNNKPKRPRSPQHNWKPATKRKYTHLLGNLAFNQQEAPQTAIAVSKSASTTTATLTRGLPFWILTPQQLPPANAQLQGASQAHLCRRAKCPAAENTAILQLFGRLLPGRCWPAEGHFLIAHSAWATLYYQNTKSPIKTSENKHSIITKESIINAFQNSPFPTLIFPL